jgi:hypothetical protein
MFLKFYKVVLNEKDRRLQMQELQLFLEEMSKKSSSTKNMNTNRDHARIREILWVLLTCCFLFSTILLILNLFN